ncbi:hypothetical protein [Pseudomonas putida]|uniref:hypothetical protein n=1 Tax=Pseudomonas putida TaxID=303 RepID=UPI001F523BFE|nr:hypothetical protein [Pseudomonas putida]MCI1037848.1 hypothetical protein [Pseudomonas putida]
MAAAVGAAGLILSLITLVMKNGENTRTIRSQLTDVLARLNAVATESRKYRIEIATGQATADQRAMFGFYNDQRAFLVGQARYLMEQIPDYVSHSELSLVAQALGAVGHHEMACYYWERSFELSPDNFISALHNRGFAGYLFGQGYTDLGRYRFQTSISLMTADSDQRRSDRVETYLRWAACERTSDFDHEAVVLVEYAVSESFLIKSKVVQNRCAQRIRDYENDWSSSLKIKAPNQENA